MQNFLQLEKKEMDDEELETKSSQSQMESCGYRETL